MIEGTLRLSAALADRYRIERELGEGGMATVYLAEDVRHKRMVALKVLKPELAAALGADRFVQEITTTASLQHPNILPLFDSGSADGFLFYVMPYVEGESLRSRLDRERQLPVLDATRITIHVADALQYAHGKGVIHRDIKPENVLLHDGHTVVADFGIALAITNAGGSRVTQTGLALGTPQYMSPEQASAERAIDGRSDVFSLGAVSYEMLAGEAPFNGPTAQATIARLLGEAPRPLALVRRSVPVHIADAIHRALEKTPADRWNNAGEFAAALGRTAVPLRVSPGRDARSARGWLVGAVGVAAFIAGVAFARTIWRESTAAPEGRSRLWTVQLPESAIFSPTSDEAAAPRQALALSRDGNRVAYVGFNNGVPLLHLLHLHDGSVTPLAGTAGARLPRFSPDGNWIAFVSDGEVRKVTVDGGALVRLAPVQSPTELFWWSDDRLLVSRSALGPAIVPSAGGRLEPLGEQFRAMSFIHTQALPGGKYLLGTTAYGDLGAISVETGALTFITVGEPSQQKRPVFARALRGISPRYLNSGYLLYASGSSLMAVPFDPGTLQTRGRPAPIASDLRNEGGAGEAHFGISDEGTVVYVPGEDGSTGRLLWADRRGQVGAPLPVRPMNVLSFRLSRDGRRLAVVERLPNSPAETFIVNLQNGVESRAKLQGEFSVMQWTRDGRRLLGYYVADTSRARGCCFTASELDASSLAVSRVDAPPDYHLLADFDESPDRALRCAAAFPGNRRESELSLLRRVDHGATPRRLATNRVQGDCAFSPDGRWLAFTNPEGLHVTEATLDSTPRQFKLVSEAPAQLRWTPDGREILYRAGRSLFAVRLTFAGGDVEASAPQRLFQHEGFFTTWDVWGAGWDLAPDGRLIVWQGPAQAPSRQLRAITHLEQRIAAAFAAPAPSR